jgi:hypothetical protein
LNEDDRGCRGWFGSIAERSFVEVRGWFGLVAEGGDEEGGRQDGFGSSEVALFFSFAVIDRVFGACVTSRLTM